VIKSAKVVLQQQQKKTKK